MCSSKMKPLRLNLARCRVSSDSQYICEVWLLPNETSNFATSSWMRAWRKPHAMNQWCGPRKRCFKRSTASSGKTIRPPSPLPCGRWKRTSLTWNPPTDCASYVPGPEEKYISLTHQAQKACTGQASKRMRWHWRIGSSKPWIGSKAHLLGTGGCVLAWPCKGNWA